MLNKKGSPSCSFRPSHPLTLLVPKVRHVAPIHTSRKDLPVYMVLSPAMLRVTGVSLRGPRRTPIPSVEGLFQDHQTGNERKDGAMPDHALACSQALKAEAKGSSHGVGIVMISGDLAVVTNGCPDPRCPLDSNVRVNDE